MSQIGLYKLVHDEARRRAAAFCSEAPLGTVVRFAEPVRRLIQNDRLQAMCHDIAKQVSWHGQKLSNDDWRHMLVASFRKGQRAVPGIDGGFVVLGASSKELSVKDCADVIEIAYAFGAEHNVVWKQGVGHETVQT